MSSSRCLLAIASLTASALGATYSQTDSYVGSQFLSGFQHMAIADPTNGRVCVTPPFVLAVLALVKTVLIRRLVTLQELRGPGDCPAEEPDIHL